MNDIHQTQPLVVMIFETIHWHVEETSIQQPADEAIAMQMMVDIGTVACTTAVLIDKMTVEDAFFAQVTRKDKDGGHRPIKRCLDNDSTNTKRACVMKTPPPVDIQRDNKAAEEEKYRQLHTTEIADKRTRMIYMKGVKFNLPGSVKANPELFNHELVKIIASRFTAVRAENSAHMPLYVRTRISA